MRLQWIGDQTIRPVTAATEGRPEGPAGADPADRPAHHPHPFTRLDPATILDACESAGWRGDGRLLALNSYENRVYQVWLEDRAPVVVKFYRPDRWSDEQILEEHAFTRTLADAEIPVVAPESAAGTTLHRHAGFRFAVYPRRGGRAPELEDLDTLRWIGRFIGRIHTIGAQAPFRERESVDPQTLGRAPRDWLCASGMLPPEVAEPWQAAAAACLDRVERAFARAGDVARLRLHGDCHAGNVLWTDDGPHFVDFDDARTGPAVQDLWMLLSGEGADRRRELDALLAGYQTFRDFDRRELALIEPLRTLRLLHYSAWIARRWADPAFPAAFPWFGSAGYWSDRILELREQAAAMDESDDEPWWR